jgi:predicted metal-binding membrane protein
MSVPAVVAPARPPGRRRGPARLIWTAVAACWVATVAAGILGPAGLPSGDGHGHDLAAVARHWRLATFAVTWTVMVGAMMLPSTAPMLELFWAVSARAPRPALARTAVLTPYFGVWLGFAGLALAGDAVLHTLVSGWAWAAARPGLVFGGVLVLAGGFQFSRLKQACLRACRSPTGMLWRHYRRGVGAAWALGVRHALLCLGCCWALMLVMFATGAASLAWMLLLTAVMVAERTMPWGRRLVTPAGVAFIASGLLIGITAGTAPAVAATDHGRGPDLSLTALLLVALVLGMWAAAAARGAAPLRGPRSGGELRAAGQQAGEQVAVPVDPGQHLGR